MANERKPKASKNKNLEDQVVASVCASSSPSKMTPKSKAPKKPESPDISPEESLHSPSGSDEVQDDDEVLDVNGSEEEEEDLEELKNESTLAWPKTDDYELFKRIRKACPKDDTMKYDSRVNHLKTSWEQIKFGDYTADQCKERWLFVQSHLRHYRLLGELLDDASVWVDRPWCNFNKGGKNNQKHPDQPKKPLTSYMQFYMDQKDSILEKNPKLGMTELSKVVAKMYHELSDRKKQNYLDKAEKAKEEYQEKMKEFMESHPEYVLPKSKQSSKPVPPKLPTPFKLFSDAKLPGFLSDNIPITEAKERCRDAYKDLSDKQKLKWIYQALEKEKEYNEEMEKFKAEHPDVEMSAKKQSLLTKDELQIKHKKEGKPDKPPNSGYSLFSKNLLSSGSLKNFETKERMTEISRLWKELSEEDKAVYNEKVNQMNHTYKMKYASYLETLTEEQRNAELISSVTKGVKRTVGKKDEQAAGKKLKVNSKVDTSSPESSSVEDVASDEEDFQIPKKPTIQKPNSSLQMFCNTNMTKYSSKHPKLSKQELTRLMAKEFAKLSEDKKKIYGNMAQKSQSEMPSTSKQSTKATTSKIAAKPAPASKKAKQAATAASESPERSPSKKDGKNPKSLSKVKPSLNADAKSSPGKASPKTSAKTSKGVLPRWAENQSLFNANEPPKPPEKPEEYYALLNSKNGTPSSTEINIMWEKLNDKQKKKYIEEHRKKQSVYVKDFENFIRSLDKEDIKRYRAFMKNREKELAQRKSAENDGSSDEEENSGSSNEDPSSNDERQPSIESSDDGEEN